MTDGMNRPADLDPAQAEWKLEIPAGYSSPVIGGDHLFVSAQVKGSLDMMAIDRDTGKQLKEEGCAERSS